MSAAPDPKHTNRLIDSTSPYLLQHAHNPVDWYPWGEEALQRARAEDRPIFLSIGYAACHWCHVMERESFESEDVAGILNREFVPIKVDREERPDLDEIYMTATQIMTHSGGWPMSVFLTPELKPFYAGTYFPPEDRWGRPGFKTLLLELARLWHGQRQRLEEQADRLAEAVEQVTSGEAGQGAITEEVLKSATIQLSRGWDRVHGGFGSAPKFPPSMRLELLLRRADDQHTGEQLHIVRHTLDHMARGGMYDQVGGGFHRYSVDAEWLVPHFEKMLYDNALLSRIYTLAYETTGDWYYRRVATEILDYVIREMTHPDGGIYSTTDADSEGEEGKFFVWSPEEVREVLGSEAGERFCRIYDITPGGNFEGRSIPNLLRKDLAGWAEVEGTTAEALDHSLVPDRQKLWQRREQRVHPLLDDKILSGWNGLMIRAFAEGFRVFGDQRYQQAAERAAGFVLTRLRGADGNLLRSFRNGKAHLNAYLEDYAHLAVALLDLHTVTAEARWKDGGLRLIQEMDARFWDETSGGYFFTSHDHESLIARVKNMQDNATPSGNSMAALALIRAAKLTGEERYRERAARLLTLAVPTMSELPVAMPNMLVAADEFLREWPGGVTIPGSDAVTIEGFLSQTAMRPGERFWIGVRLNIREGYHVNGSEPRQEYLIPTRFQVPNDEEFVPVQESYPEAVPYRAGYEGEELLVYTGTQLVGLELEARPGLAPGHHPLDVTLRVQPCDDAQCYPPLEARMRFMVAVREEGGAEQHPELFNTLRARVENVA